MSHDGQQSSGSGRFPVPAPRAGSVAGALAPHVERLFEFFRVLGVTIKIGRRYGWAHQESVRRVDAMAETLQRTVTLDGEVRWFVHPHSFSLDKHLVWEPQGTNSDIPYNLFAGGFRSMMILPGFARPELEQFLHWLTMDPETDLPPEDDLATVFWEMNLPFVDYQLSTVVSVGAGDSGIRTRFDWLTQATLEFLEDAASLRGAEDQRLTSSHQRVSMAEASPPLRAPTPGVADDVGDLMREPEVVMFQRLGRVVAWSVLDGISVGDAHLIEGPLAELRHHMLADGRLVELLQLYSQLMIGLVTLTESTEYGTHLLPPWALKEVLGRIVPLAEEPPGPDWIEEVAQPLTLLLHYLAENYLEQVMEAVGGLTNERLIGALLHYVESHLQGREHLLGTTLEKSPPGIALPLIELLSNLHSRSSLPPLRRAGKNPDESIQQRALEARAAIEPQDVADDLRALLGSPSDKLRNQALRLIGMLNLRRMIAPLAARCADKSFHQASRQEREATLDLLWSFDAKRAERVAIDLAIAGKMADRHRHESQIVALGLLARKGQTFEALDAARAAGKGLLVNRDVREAATRAHEQLSTRLEE